MKLDLPELYKAVDQCLIKDRHSLRQQVKRLEALSKGRAADDEATNATLIKDTEKLIARIQRSQQVVASRSQPLALTYPDLPVSERRDDILQAIQNHQVVVIAGETGSGKTTQLPKLCIEAGLGRFGRIGHTQPRRLAARAVAQRIADELQTPLGQAVGYQVRFTDQSQDDSRIKVMTDGILLAQTQGDRFLNEYDVIIIDEAHERSLNIDFLLGYLHQLLQKRRDLKLVITSATIDVERFSKHFDNAPIIEVSGRTFPVEMRYRPLVRISEDEEDRSLFEGVRDALDELRLEDSKNGQPGDVLVFLPGEREIRECTEFLRRSDLPATDILPLYARLSGADQQRIFKPHGGRRVVLSTNVAETSLTVPGIKYVIDSGVARISRYSYRSKVQRLPVEAVSQASANQRAGRCGRTSPGICIRLYEEQDFIARSEFTDPEIRRTNLASVILQMLDLRLGDIRDFPFVDAPDERFVKDGFTLLAELEAVDAKKRITPLGQRMARLPLDPRIARLLMEADKQQCVRELTIIASAMTVQDPRERPPEKQQAAAEKHKLWADDDSDFVAMINLWNAYEVERQTLTQNQLRKWCAKHFLSFMRMREWRDIHRQLHIVCKELGLKERDESANYEAVHKALLSGMLSQIGFKAEGQEYLGARNRRFFLFPGSSIYKKAPKWVMAAEMVETSRLYARTLAKIEPEWIEEIGKPLLKYQYFEPHWSTQRGQVLAFEQSTLYGLIVNPKKRVNYATTHPEEAREILITEGLVAQRLKSRVGFYQDNIRLLRDVTEYEEKARRRDLVLDDAYLADFYRAHLPTHLFSARDIERWYNKASKVEQSSVQFTRDMLLSPQASGIGVDAYPAELEWQGLAFPLSYSFAPGASDDGVTLTVPLAMLRQVPEPRIEWLVPGLVANKVIAIIKGLPKNIRKQFVPVPDTATEFLRQANPDAGGLFVQLLEFINRTLRPKIELDVLQNGQLEAHLQMNIRILQDGKQVEQGRDLRALIERFGDAGQVQMLTLSDDRYQRSDIQKWDFGSLPTATETKINGLPVRAFPCLKATKSGVELTVEADSDAALQSHREGVLHLLRQSLSPQERDIKQLIQKSMKPHWLLAKGLGSESELVNDLLSAVFAHILLPQSEPLPRNEDEFNQRLDRRGELWAHAETLMGLFVEWLKIRHQILKHMRGAVSLDKAMAFSDAKAHLERLLERGFMLKADWPRLKSYSRYLKGIEYRLDKLQGNLPRDRQSMIEFESIYTPWRDLTEKNDAALRSTLVEFGWLLEELRISLFAQPLGTQEPVSLKRLQKRWADIVQGG